jgi:hypothetical protein
MEETTILLKKTRRKSLFKRGRICLKLQKAVHILNHICMNETAADSFEMLATTINYRNLGFK